MAVLQWTDPKEKQSISVANIVYRLTSVAQRITSVAEWNHDATKDNPADAATRWISTESLQPSSWIKGQKFFTISSFYYLYQTEML